MRLPAIVTKAPRGVRLISILATTFILLFIIAQNLLIGRDTVIRKQQSSLSPRYFAETRKNSLDSRTNEPPPGVKVKPTRVPDIVTRPGRNATSVKQIALLGERNTGTTWITAHLRDCFAHELPVKTSLVRHKHWFQHDILEKARVRDTLVVAEFRNPCYWVEAMQRKEYRTPMHYKVKDWFTFVTTPWTMPTRMQYDLDLVEEHRKANGGVVNYSAIQCQADFTYNQINSCLSKPYLEGKKFVERAKRRKKRKKQPIFGDERDEFSGQEPWYELRNDGSGSAYNTILEMRSDKIKNFLDVAEWDWIAAVLPVQYEELVRHGTAALIRNIETVTGVKAKCTPSPPQNRTSRKLPDDFVEWMTKHLDWDTERLIGFTGCYVTG